MQYRQFGRLKWDVSALGFGLMRLPTLNDDYAQIDEPQAARLLYTAIEQGVNYIDTAYGYHGGNSERFAGRTLKGSWRDQVRLATKLPCWLVKQAGDFDTLLNEQLERLQTDHVDLYLLHALNQAHWNEMQRLGVLEWAEKAKRSGRIRHFGFSFHDNYEVFTEILNAYDNWDFCQIQYNYMDIDNQAGTMGLKYAASRGLAVVVMEPLLGGKLVNPPDSVKGIWDNAPVKREPVEWALHWLWSQPEVSVVLSGMSSLAQVRQNLDIAGKSAIGLLTEADQVLFTAARHEYSRLCPIPCTGCEYCLPCAGSLHIPRLFDLYNSAFMYNQLEESRSRYRQIPAAELAGECLDCHTCEAFCPQQIEISAWMPKVHAVLGEGKPPEAVI